MNYKIATIANFRKEAKKLIKKYHSLKNEIETLGKELSKNPTLGTPLGNNCYKIRLSIASKGKGKSGGARVITYIFVNERTVYFLSLYDKSEKENITDQELKNLLKNID